MFVIFVLFVWFVMSSCSSQKTRELAPLPEQPPAELTRRGSEAATRGITGEDEARIITIVVRQFFRPTGDQARWIDPRPLAHERSAEADSAMKPDEDRAEVLVESIGLSRVCVLGEDTAECKGKSGGSLRFSPVYKTGKDSAVVFARYVPLQGGPVSELEFKMVHDEDGWDIGTRRSLEQPRAPQRTPRSVADELLAADRAFAAAAKTIDLVSALSAMFDDDIILPAPGGFERGRAAARTAMLANQDNVGATVSWTPVRVGISADGQHGFSFGYLTVVRRDSIRQPQKYLAYWVKRPVGWRVAVYRRRGRPAREEVSTALMGPTLMMMPSLPDSLVAPINDTATIRRHRESLMAAEKEFSDTAQVIGIGNAFERYGRRSDAMNMGGPTDTAFVIGSPAIARSVGAGYPPTGSTVSWASDYHAIVASSGDLGVSIGFIRPNAPAPAGQPQRAFPFFTIWKREPGGPWRYIAE